MLVVLLGTIGRYSMRVLPLLLVFLLFPVGSGATHTAAAAKQYGSWLWNPDGLLFAPLRAHTLEPRIGMLYEFGEDKLRLDIGTSLDLLAYCPDSSGEFRVGTDFFTYTRLRSEGSFKFPVETTDFFFGVNASAKYSIAGHVVSGRLRIAHISSHISDGYNGPRTPFVYSREFVDVTGTLTLSEVRLYAGINVLFSTIPDNFGVVTPQLGVDVSYPLSATLALVGGYDARFPTIQGAATGVHSAQFGIKVGEQFGKGIVLNGYAYSGKSLHGMFYDIADSYMGLGFQVDL